jgi:hypothetical protein
MFGLACRSKDIKSRTITTISLVLAVLTLPFSADVDPGTG